MTINKMCHFQFEMFRLIFGVFRDEEVRLPICLAETLDSFRFIFGFIDTEEDKLSDKDAESELELELEPLDRFLLFGFGR